MSPGAPSPLVLDWLPALREAAALGPLVDLACGRGRHALALAREGLPVVALDRNAESLEALRSAAAEQRVELDIVRTDLETGGALPLAARSCGAILVFRYLHRPLASALAAALAPGGLLLYETFTIHQRELGYGPGRAEFLLEPGELPRLFPGLAVLHHWEGLAERPKPAQLAQLVAQRPG